MSKSVSQHCASLSSKCKLSKSLYTDPDFGPTDADERGGKSLYGLDEKPPGGQYPRKEKIRWDRPIYADGEEEEEEGEDDEGEEEDIQDEDEEEDEWDDEVREKDRERRR